MIENIFTQRYSPYTFADTPISDNEREAMFEAARWSPSCYNEQPWRFVFAKNKSDIEKFQSTLVEANQTWANHAPMLIYLFAKKSFTQNDKPNRWSAFDVGAAWMALTFQANKLGLHTHAMGGFDRDRAYGVTGVDEKEYDVLCAIAVGKSGDTVKKNDTRRERKSLDEIVFEGKFDA